MRKIILIVAILFLASCWMTNQEKIDAMDLCKDSWYSHYRTLFTNEVECSRWEIEEDDRVMKCIREYTEGIDQKYNNPDHVQNLREDQYSNVVKTCNDIFGEKILK